MGKEDSEAMKEAGKQLRSAKKKNVEYNLYNMIKVIDKYNIAYNAYPDLNKICFKIDNILYTALSKTNRVNIKYECTGLTLLQLLKEKEVPLRTTEKVKTDINFGKHKGKNIDMVIKEDKQYVEWLFKQDWLKEDLKNKIDTVLNQQKVAF